MNQSTEDYLKSIYHLQIRLAAEHTGPTAAKVGDQIVPTSALAKHLKIGDGSVTDMVKKLSEKQLINYEPYQGVTLTEAGRRVALKMVRRHRLWEMFLVKFLGYTWDEIHDEAELLEHVTSDEMESRLDQALGYPKVDPHGDPIPTADGVLKKITYRRLSQCEAHDMGIIVRVSDESQEALQLLTKLGLGLNKKVQVKQKIKFDGSVIVKVGRKEIPLSPLLAKNIFVEIL